MAEEEFDEAKEDYYSLADEATAEEAHPWNDDDWDEDAVKRAKQWAKENDWPWPPGRSTFDHLYEHDHS